MRRLLVVALLFLLPAGLWAQSTPPATDDAAQLRQEIDQLKKTVGALEQRLEAQEKAKQPAAAQTETPKEEAFARPKCKPLCAT
jgi:type II secretory pathway component PulM